MLIWWRPLSAHGSLGSSCVQVGSIAWNSLQTCSILCRSLIWLENAFFSQVQKAVESELGPSGRDDDLTESTKEELRSCLLAKYNLLSDGTLSPVGVFSGNPHYPFSHLGFSYNKAMETLGCPSLPWPCLCAMAFCCLKLTPNVFSCVQKPDLAWKCLLFTRGNELHIVK